MTTLAQKRGAAAGAYGAAPFDPIKPLADALLADVREELAQADAWTREDLLFLPSLMHVSTITRYRYVCEAVAYLLRSGKVHALSRTELCLPGKAKRYVPPAVLAEEFRGTVRRHAFALMQRHKANGRGTASVQEVIDLWKTDPHLTVNSKRVVVRAAFRAMVRDGLAVETAPGAIGAPEA